VVRTVRVSDGVHEELTMLKLRLKLKTYDEVIKYLLDTIKKQTTTQEVKTKDKEVIDVMADLGMIEVKKEEVQ